MKTEKLFHRDFTLVVIGQIISLFGNGIIRFAMPLYLLNVTKSAALFGLAGALAFLPMIVLTPVGGIIADRVNKRNIMVWLDFVTAGVVLAFLLLMNAVNLVVLLIVTMMVLFAIQGAYQPAVQASMPLLASKDNMLRGNAIINQVSALSNLLAPIVGGLLFGLYGLVPILVVGIGCFFVSAVMEIFIRMPHTKLEQKAHIFATVAHDIGESLRFMRHDKPVIFKAILVILGFNLFLSALLVVGVPVLITQTLGISGQLYGLSQGISAAGALFGGIMTSVLAKKLKLNKIHLLLILSSLMLLPFGAAIMFDIPVIVSYWIITAANFCLMSAASMVTIQLITFVHTETPPQLVGKVMSCAMALTMCAHPVGQAIYGVLFQYLASAQYLAIFIGAAASLIVSLLSKRVFAKL